MILLRLMFRGGVGFPLLLSLCLPLQAKSARCSTTDDGAYRCEFRRTDRTGSFQISAPGKPTYILNVVRPDIAFGFANFGPRNVSLPGRYLRSNSKPSCWINDTTSTSICAQ
jgi:hypothetical protein